jgi:flagellar FliJ protein
MATSSALETLIELASKETDEAAKRLGKCMMAAEETEKKLALLMQYRDDYAARFQQNLTSGGLSAMGYHNFQVFLGKLDQAIDSQRQTVREAHERVAQERSAWQAGERKRMSYGTLVNRAEKAQQIKENKRDQKQMDEHAARQLLYKK